MTHEIKAVYMPESHQSNHVYTRTNRDGETEVSGEEVKVYEKAVDIVVEKARRAPEQQKAISTDICLYLSIRHGNIKAMRDRFNYSPLMNLNINQVCEDFVDSRPWQA